MSTMRAIQVHGSSNIAFLRALGADEVIDYTQTRVEEKVQGVDLVLDTVSGAGTTSTLATLRREGETR